MRLELGRRADYAIRAAVDLARHAAQGDRRKARAIAEEMAIPASYVPQILAELVRAGIAESVAGRDGGYVLTRTPADISLLDLLRAVDGEVVSTSCVLRNGPCRWQDVCAVHVPWAQAQQALLATLSETTFEDIVRNDTAIEAGVHQLPDGVQPPHQGPGSAVGGTSPALDNVT